MKFRPIIIILFIFLFGTFQVNAAVKCDSGTGISPKKPIEGINTFQLEQRDVPEGFFHCEIQASEFFKSLKSESWQTRVTLYNSEGFLWAHRYSLGHILSLEGRPKSFGGFTIDVSSASQRLSNQPAGIKYNFPKNTGCRRQSAC